MASRGTKLSIYSTFDNAGTKQADRAMKAFASNAGTMSAAGVMAVDPMSAALAATSIKLDQLGVKMKTVGASMVGVGTTLTKGVTAPIVAIGALSANAAIDFEASFAAVRKTVDATDEEFAALEQSSRDLAKTSPVTADTINGIMALGGQLGIANDKLVDFAKTVSGLDIATDLDSETAATELAQFANITKMSQDDMDNFGSSLVDLGNNSATTESAIMAMAMRIAASGTQVGLTNQEILGMSAALSSVGIEAESGGSAISKTMTEIDKAVAMNSDSLSVWADTAGMSVDQFKTAWGQDAAGALQAVFAGMGNVTEEGGNLNVLLDDLGITELRQSDTMKRLANASDLVSTSIDTANTGWSENTALTDEVNAKNDTTAAKLETLKNRANDIGITLGGPVADSLTDVMDAAEPLIEDIADAAEGFADMDKESQKTVLELLAVAAAIGPVTIGAGKLVTGVGALTGAYGKATAQAAAWTAKILASETASVSATVAARGLNLAMTAMGPIAIAGAVVGISALIGKVMSLNSPLAQAQSALDATLASYTSFADGIESKTGQVGELGSIFTSTGQTIESVDQQIADAETNITNALNTAVQENGRARLEDIASVQKYYDDIIKLTGEKGDALVTSIEGVGYQAQAMQGKLSADDTQQYVADINAKFDSAKEAYTNGHAQEIDAITQKYYAEGQLGSAAYTAAVQSENKRYSEQVANAQKVADEQTAIVENSFASQTRSTEAGWDAVTAAATEGANVMTDSVTAAVVGGDEATAVAAQRAAENAVTAYANGLASVDWVATDAWMSAATATRASGADLDAATSANVKTMLDALSNFPPGAEAEATEAARTMASGLTDSIPALQNASTMTASEIVAAINSYFGMGGTTAAGKEAAAGLARGLAADGSPSRTASQIAKDVENIVTGEWSDSYDWGADMADGIADGMTSQVGNLQGKARLLAKSVNSVLHHSTPDEGPLKGDDKWGAELGEQFASSLLDSVPAVSDAARSVADAAALSAPIDTARTIVYQHVAAGTTTSENAVGSASYDNRTYNSTYHITIDGSKMPSSDLEGLLASIEQAKKMGVLG